MMTNAIPFSKMNGLGNDFVVVDARSSPMRFSGEQIARIADRDTGIGCDQFIVMENVAGAPDIDVFMRIYNQEGFEVDACGNATRCIGRVIMDEKAATTATVMTNAGVLFVSEGEVPGTVTVDMGVPKFGWDEIPLAEQFHDTTGIELQLGPIDAPLIHTPSVVNVGNPHAVFWVNNLDVVDLAKAGPLLENHPMFPERANISLALVESPTRIRLKVWERGAGLTRACGTAACAAAVCGARKRLTERAVEIVLPGGPLAIDWREDTGRILMTGPYAHDYDGEIPASLIS